MAVPRAELTELNGLTQDQGSNAVAGVSDGSAKPGIAVPEHTPAAETVATVSAPPASESVSTLDPGASGGPGAAPHQTADVHTPPAAQAAAAQPAGTSPVCDAHQAGVGGGQKAQPKDRVLIIEDDPIMRMLLKRGLSNFGFDCLLTENGRAAQEVLQKDRPDVLLVDLLMPVMDGLAFIKWLRQTAHDSTPVVVFTTVDNPKVKDDVLKSGADHFASKPLHVRELAETMKSLIASRRANK
ncbi:MAG: response regulator [Verrucomicrobiae bacterium]|nr:response regulator [Verrucomicrobiae bacterium]MDW7980702.1 response regulator [Verrucomicrobiales bacterium]